MQMTMYKYVFIMYEEVQYIFSIFPIWDTLCLISDSDLYKFLHMHTKHKVTVQLF